MVKALENKGIKASVVGELTAPGKGMVLVEKGKEKKLVHPIVDPFWRAFYDALEKLSEKGLVTRAVGQGTMRFEDFQFEYCPL